MQVTIYHNPRCSKSREALALLRERGVEPQIVEYLKNPPSAAELKGILDLLGMEPRALMRRKEPPYAERGLDDPTLAPEALVAAMSEAPVLIERPIVVVERDGRKSARLGRPPERVLEVV